MRFTTPETLTRRSDAHGRRHLVLLGALALCVQASGVVRAETPVMIPVRGEVFYLQRIALGPDAVVEVAVEDVSRADVRAEILERVRIEPAGQVPIPFELTVATERVDPRHTYAIRARIHEGGRLRWVTTERRAVRLDGYEFVRVRVDPVGRGRDLRVRPDSNASELARVADYVEAHTGQMRRVTQGPETAGDATLALEAFFDGEQLKLVVEQVAQGDYGAVDRRYFIDGDRLYHYRSAGMELAPDNSAVVPVERRVYLGPQGEVLYASKSVGGRPSELLDHEVPAILERAARLRARLAPPPGVGDN